MKKRLFLIGALIFALAVPASGTALAAKGGNKPVQNLATTIVLDPGYTDPVCQVTPDPVIVNENILVEGVQYPANFELNVDINYISGLQDSHVVTVDASGEFSFPAVALEVGLGDIRVYDSTLQFDHTFIWQYTGCAFLVLDSSGGNPYSIGVESGHSFGTRAPINEFTAPALTGDLWARADCYSNTGVTTIVMAQYVNIIYGINHDTLEFVLGPTPSWSGGGADCTVRLYSLNGYRQDKLLASNTFTVLP